MTAFHYVIWDMDGVLVDSERHWDTKDDFFLARELDNWSEFDESRLIGRSLADIYQMLKDEMDLQMSYEEYRKNYDATAKQIYSIAKWLAANAKVLILDEPTKGIDVGSKASIHKMMSDLANQGKAILMISSEISEILGMSDRILVMNEGILAAELSIDDATQEKVLEAALGSKRKYADINR